MLTPVHRQVNTVMVVAHSNQQTAHAAQQTLVAQALQPLLARRRPERILVLKQAGVGDLLFETVNSAQIIRLSAEGPSADAMVHCRIEALPFEEAAFGLVILHHLISDGAEPFLAEAIRVMAAGGDVVISGLNSSGLRNRIGNRRRRMPALKLDRVCNFLKSSTNFFVAGSPLPITKIGLCKKLDFVIVKTGKSILVNSLSKIAKPTILPLSSLAGRLMSTPLIIKLRYHPILLFM